MTTASVEVDLVTTTVQAARDVIEVQAATSMPSVAIGVPGPTGPPGSDAPPGSGTRDLLYSPAAGQLTVDEFNHDALDPAWVRVDAPGGAGRSLWTELGDALSGQNLGGDASQEMHALVRPLAAVGGPLAVGDAFITRAQVYQPSGFANNYSMAGIVLADGTTYGAGNQVAGFIYPGWQVCAPFTGFNTWGTFVQDTAQNSYQPTWVRLVWLGGSTWRTDVGSDGISWFKGSPASKAVTPTHVGLWVSSWSTGTKAITTYETLRRVAGVT